MRRARWIATAAGAATLIMAMAPGSAQAATRKAGPAHSGHHAKVSSAYRIAFVPKLIGIPYFTSMEKGAEAAAKRFGGKFIYEGPTTASVEGQDEDVATLIKEHVSAVGVSANAASSVCPDYANAIKAGIVVYASDSNVSCKDNELWVEQATNQGIGNLAVDTLAKEIKGSGDIAIVSAGSTATNLDSWIAVMKKRLKRYPRLHLVSVQYAGENISQSETVGARLIAAYPKLKGMIGVASTNVPGLAEAVKAAGDAGKIAVTGETDPNTIRPWIEDGVVKAVVLWNPTSLGYLMYWGVLQVLEHHPFKAENAVPGLPGKYEYFPASKTLLLGPPLLITKANVNLNF
ncbi:MAG: autoinducer 2 ABC transporter substrate-binding protein [Actinomycetota bacterium]|nr:autoinducer 2 ABC transporter substrate-binding protein [Actinomycetota bacterium]